MFVVVPCFKIVCVFVCFRLTSLLVLSVIWVKVQEEVSYFDHKKTQADVILRCISFLSPINSRIDI